MIYTQRLSPKNQVTLPWKARCLQAAGEVEHLRGMKHAMASSASGRTFPMLVLMTEAELQRCEQRIVEDQTLTKEQRLEHIMRLNGEMAMMAIDGQHRVVLPAEFVSYLKLEREIHFVPTNTSIFAWHPDDFLAWQGHADQPAANPALSAYLI